MNKIKEKKLNSIKSQIAEIIDFAASTHKEETKQSFINNESVVENKENNTFTLTKIVNYAPYNPSPLLDVDFIKCELNIIKSILLKQEKFLETIFLKRK